MVISTKFTHSDLLVMPNDGKRREIVAGDLFVTPSPRFQHQRISARIHAAFVRYLDVHPIGEVAYAPLDVILSEHDVLGPDLLFVLNAHLGILQDWVRGAPDLVVEILSPTTEAIHRGPKLKAYARSGVAECWIVDTDHSAIELYRLSPRGYQLERVFDASETFTSSLVPGFQLPVENLFQP